MLGEKPGHSTQRGRDREKVRERRTGNEDSESNPERQDCVKKNAIFATCSLPGEKLALSSAGVKQHRGQVHQGYMTRTHMPPAVISTHSPAFSKPLAQERSELKAKAGIVLAQQARSHVLISQRWF